ncbi:MAG: ClpXP protease specificity-enhancing factor SspB [Pseudomonadota bacterium]|nr:ClpXP protease specificity-enhancing factor SspB [Pseudomonadota bacterium]
MSKETIFLDYNILIRSNLLNVVRQALHKTADYGLSDGHHFYITFLTKFKGNTLPHYLSKEYPESMMIVIENEYYNLKVHEDFFSVDLKFKGKIETLKIMFDSLLSFVDPSVSFNLNLDVIGSKKKKFKNKKIQQSKKAKLENKSNIIYFRPNKE